MRSPFEKERELYFFPAITELQAISEACSGAFSEKHNSAGTACSMTQGYPFPQIDSDTCHVADPKSMMASKLLPKGTANSTLARIS
jgi:hypothetical protein